MTRFRCFGVLALAALAVGVVLTAANAQPPRGGPPGGPGRFMGRRGPGFMGVPGRGGLLLLLRNPQVQEELNLSDSQKEQIDQLSDKQRDEMRALFGDRGDREGLQELSPEQRMARFQEMMERLRKEAEKRAPEIEKQVAQILEPPQFKRLKQIELQRRGVDALVSADVIQALALTEAQQEKIKEVLEQRDSKREELGNQMREGMTPGGFRQRSEQERQQFRQRMQEFGEKRRAIDTEAQKAAMAVLTDEQKAGLPNLMGEPFEMRPPERPGGGPPGGGRPRGRRPGEGRPGGR